MQLDRAIGDFRNYQRDVAGKSRRTYEGYYGDLMQVFYKLAPENSVKAFTPELAARTVAALRQHGLKPASILRHVAAMKALAAWGLLQSQRHWTLDPTRELPKIPLGRRHPKPFTRDELGKLMRLELPRQERAIRGLLYWTGMRATPLCELRPHDVDFVSTTLTLPDGTSEPVAGRITSTGKGGVETIHYMQEPLKDILWDQLQAALEAGSPTLVWRTFGRRQQGRLGRHNASTVLYLCRKWGRAAGVAKVHPHRFRHSFATQMARAGVHPAVIQALMAHAKIATTMQYIEVDSAVAASAARGLAHQWWLTEASRAAEIAALEARLAELRRDGHCPESGQGAP